MSNDPNDSLRKRLRSLLTAEFDGLSTDAVAGVLSGLASELQQLSEAGPQQISEIAEDHEDWVQQGLTGRPRIIGGPAAGSGYEISAETHDRISGLVHQILTVGAVLLKVEDPPPLNDFIELTINFPTLHLSMHTQGRVVHNSEEGTAVEVSGLPREDRVALEKLQHEYPHGVVPDDEEPEKEERRASADEAPGPVQSGRTLRSARASDSIPIPGLGARSFERSFRRSVDLTTPDVKVLSQNTQKKVASTREFYGPAVPWTETNGDPDRVEKLAADRVIDILLHVSQDGLTGLLQYEHGDQKRQIMLDGGLIVEVACEPRNADEELGLMLYNADRIAKQQLAMAAAHADEKGGSIARSLLDLDILDAEQIRQAIAGRLTYLMREALDWDEGEIEVFSAQQLPAGFLPTPPLRVHIASERIIYRRLFEEFKQVTLKERERRVGDHLDAYPEALTDERDRVERALTDDGHKGLVTQLLSGRRRLKEVFTESSLSHAETFAVVNSLHRMGLVRFDRSLHQTIVRERYRENVTVKYLSVHKASYFEVINVHWSSYDAVVEKAYNELVGSFDPDKVPESLEAEVHTRVSEIRERIESAFQVLADRETRHAYRKRIMPEYKLAHAIPLFMKQAELAERRQQWNEALDAVKRVLEIDPENREGELKAERLVAILENRLSPDANDSNF